MDGQVSPTRWFITGDRDKAIQNLTGLGKRLLYTVKNWRKVGNLNFKDSGWITYADGSKVRAVSSFDYDQIHIYSPKEMMIEEQYEMKQYNLYTYSGRTVKRSLRDLSAIWENTSASASNIILYRKKLYCFGTNPSDSYKLSGMILDDSDGTTIQAKTDITDGDGTLYSSGLAVDPTGFYIIKQSTGPIAILEKRSLDLTEDLWSITINPGKGMRFLSGSRRQLCADNKNVYIAYTDNYTAYGQWTVEAYLKEDGTLLWQKQISSTLRHDRPRGIAVDNTGVYVGGYFNYDTEPNQTIWRVEKREIDTGNIIWEVNLSTNTTLCWGSTASLMNSLDSDTRYLYTCGLRDCLGEGTANQVSVIEKRKKSDGSIFIEIGFAEGWHPLATTGDTPALVSIRYLTPRVLELRSKRTLEVRTTTTIPIADSNDIPILLPRL